MTEDELIAIVDAEAQDAMGYADKLSEQREKALYYYRGEAKGDLAPPEIDGRSAVVSTDLMDTIEWVMPSIMRIFASGDKVVQFDPRTQEDEGNAEQATDYVNYIIWTENDGFKVLHNWFKDALLQKVGIIKVYCEVETVEKREEYTLNDDEMAMLLQDEAVEPIEHSVEIDQATGLTLHKIAVKVKQDKKKFHIRNVPPEEFLIDRKATSIEDARFTGHQFVRTIGELRAAGYKNLDELSGEDNGLSTSAEGLQRAAYDDWSYQRRKDVHSSADEAGREVTVTEAYMKVDFDGDGIQEWRKVTKCGAVLLDNEECDGPPFCTITPILMPHRFFGLSYYDVIKDIQNIKTVLLRQTLDNVYMVNNGRYYVDTNQQVNLDDLLNARPGGIVRGKGPNGVQPLTPPALGQWAFSMLEYTDNIRENRTGVTKYNQGLDSQSLNKTATGVSIIQNNAMARIELIARIFAETGVKDLMRQLLKLIKKYQTEPKIVRLRNTYVPMDPRSWTNEFDMSVNVGIGNGNKDQMAQHLMMMMQVQREAIQIGVATPENIYNAAKKLAENMGFKNSDMFFTNPAQMPQQQGPDPEQMLQEEKMKLEAEKVKQDIDAMNQDALLKAKTIASDFELSAKNLVEGFITKYQQAEIKEKEGVENEKAMQKEMESSDLLNRLMMMYQESNQTMGQLMKVLAAPKQAIRGEDGRVIGIQPVIDNGVVQ